MSFSSSVRVYTVFLLFGFEICERKTIKEFLFRFQICERKTKNENRISFFVFRFQKRSKKNENRIPFSFFVFKRKVRKTKNEFDFRFSYFSFENEKRKKKFGFRFFVRKFQKEKGKTVYTRTVLTHHLAQEAVHRRLTVSSGTPGRWSCGKAPDCQSTVIQSHLPPFRNLGNFVHLTSPVSFGRELKAGDPF